MATLGNSPASLTMLRVEARKSFSFGVYLSDPVGRPVDLTDCRLRIVAKPSPVTVEADNLLDADADAHIEEPTHGYARFELQAATLDFPPGEYPYAIVLYTPEGYSSVIVKGVLQLEQNTDWEAVVDDYPAAQPSQRIDVMLRESNTISVYIGSQLPPGMNYVRGETLEAIEAFDPSSVALVPVGGASGYVLTKTTADDYQMQWRPVGNGAFALDASGQPENHIPTAQGDGTWSWAPAGINAAGVAEGWAPVANGDGTWDWAEVDTAPSDWEAEPGESGAILNKPDLGTIAARDEDDFVESGTLVSELPGIHFRTTVPTTGEDGHLYFVYTE